MSGIRTVVEDLAGKAHSFSSSLAGRLMIWFFAASFLMVFISSVILYWATVHALQYADDQVLEKRMLAMRTLLQTNPTTDIAVQQEVSVDDQGPRQIFMRVIGGPGTPVVETPAMSRHLLAKQFPDVENRPLDELARTTIVQDEGLTFRSVSVRVPTGSENGGRPVTIQVATDTTLDAEGLAWFRRLLASVLAGALLLCSVVGWHIVRRELTPLRRIADATSQTSFLTLGHRLALDGLPTELHHLAVEFNEMLARLESAYSRLRHYADNVAHELRGPVSKMLLATDVTLSRARSSNDYRAELESNFEECQRLANIVDSLLFLARAENTAVQLDMQAVDVEKELGLICDFFDASAEEAGIKLSMTCEKGLTVEVERVLFQRAITNLVSNALAHTPSGGRITIEAKRSPGRMIAIDVVDTGEGIPIDAQVHIFDRFYRADQVRSPTSGRVGLGLPITRSIMMLHGGTIAVESKPGFGTRMKLEFRACAA
jgi:two-component system heavy metal sensor histidine kinase CusS